MKLKQLPDGRWQVWVNDKELFGKKRPTRIEATKNEAKQWAEKKVEDEKQRRGISAKRTILFGEALDLVEEDAHQRHASRMIEPGYRDNILRGVRFCRAVGHTPLKLITRSDCQRVIYDELKRCPSGGSAYLSRLAFNRAFLLAKRAWNAPNPLTGDALEIKLPPKDETDWTEMEDDVNRLMDSIRRHHKGAQYEVEQNRRVVILLARWCSWGPGEIAGLQRSSVNFATNRIKMAHTYAPKRGLKPYGKTKPRFRDMDMVPDLREALEVIAKRDDWKRNPNGYVLLNSEGRSIYETINATYFNYAMEAAGLVKIDRDGNVVKNRRGYALPKFTLYDLAHFCNSQLLADGVPVVAASKRMGHSRVSTTMDVYAHIIRKGPSPADEAVRKRNIEERRDRIAPVDFKPLTTAEKSARYHARWGWKGKAKG
jgi:integrase